MKLLHLFCSQCLKNLRKNNLNNNQEIKKNKFKTRLKQKINTKSQISLLSQLQNKEGNIKRTKKILGKKKNVIVNFFD